MKFSIKWVPGKYPQFNINISRAEGETEFLSIKGCRIMSGSNGEFVSYPSQKKDDGKYWNHVWGDDKFNAYILELANKSRPAREEPQQQRQQRSVEVDTSDIPF
jgi:DNA-binding cell septation regulator SpoVG